MDKILAQMAYPLGISLFLLLLVWVLIPFQRLARLLLGLIILWLYITAIPIGANLLISSLEKDFRYIRPQKAPRLDTVIVLGGTLSLNRFNQPNYQDGVDRIIYAAQLYRAGKVKTIWVSGGCALCEQDSNYGEADFMKALLVQLGVPAHRIKIESRSRNTYENARYISGLLPNKEQSIGLITSAFHMRRALVTFAKAGIDALPLPTDFQSKALSPMLKQPLSWLPDAESLYKSTIAIKEYLGYWVYQHRGRL